MPDDTVATAAAPASSAATTAETTATTTSEAASPTLEQAMEAIDFATMSDEQIAAIESGDSARVSAALGVPAPSKANKDGEQEQTGAGSPLQAALSAKTPEELDAAGQSLGRISIKALKPADRANTVRALDLIRGGKSPQEAFAEVFGIAALPPAVAEAVAAAGESGQAGEQAAASAASTPSIPELESKLADLQKQYQDAKATFDPAATDILEQMTDVKMDLREARREAADTARHWSAKEQASREAAMDKFSELITTHPEFLPYCDDELSLAEIKNDPILLKPDWPEKIGQRVADKFFNGKAARSAEPENDESNSIPPAPKQSVRLPGSPTGSSFTAGSLSPQVAMAEIDKLSTEDQDALVRSLDVLTSPRRASVHAP